MKPTRETAYEAIAKSLRQFGYPNATSKMVRETHAAMKAGRGKDDLPHGIIGMFSYAQLSANDEWISNLPGSEGEHG